MRRAGEEREGSASKGRLAEGWEGEWTDLEEDVEEELGEEPEGEREGRREEEEMERGRRMRR